MSYNIIDIEGIGPVYAQALAAANINTTEELLEAGKTPAGRKELSQACNIDEGRILTWVNLADLMRINGVSSQYSELLEAAGVDTVKELKHRNAENLAEAMDQTNAEKNLTNRVPNAPEIQKWIDQAKEMEPVVMYQNEPAAA